MNRLLCPLLCSVLAPPSIFGMGPENMLSCQAPRLDAYVAPVLWEAPGDGDAAHVPELDVVFRADGSIQSIAPIRDEEQLTEALKRSLALMRFHPASCFDEPVPGFARVAFPGYFVLQSPAASAELELPFCRLAFTRETRAQLGSIGTVLELEWLSALLVVDENGALVEVRNKNPKLARAVRALLGPIDRPFIPAMLNGQPVRSELMLHWRANAYRPDPSPGDRKTRDEPSTPLPAWPAEMELAENTLFGLTLFTGSEGRVEGAYLHPDVPEALKIPLLDATRRWRFEDPPEGTAVAVQIGAYPSTREIVILEQKEAVFTSPTPKTQREPSYPRAFLGRGVEGSVRLEFVIDERGRVPADSITVLAATHEAFAETTVAAIERWRFDPATFEGQPVSTVVRITVPFSIGR